MSPRCRYWPASLVPVYHPRLAVSDPARPDVRSRKATAQESMAGLARVLAHPVASQYLHSAHMAIEGSAEALFVVPRLSDSFDNDTTSLIAFASAVFLGQPTEGAQALDASDSEAINPGSFAATARDHFGLSETATVDDVRAAWHRMKHAPETAT